LPALPPIPVSAEPAADDNAAPPAPTGRTAPAPAAPAADVAPKATVTNPEPAKPTEHAATTDRSASQPQPPVQSPAPAPAITPAAKPADAETPAKMGAAADVDDNKPVTAADTPAPVAQPTQGDLLAAPPVRPAAQFTPNAATVGSDAPSTAPHQDASQP
jgi:hypothetical protein